VCVDSYESIYLVDQEPVDGARDGDGDRMVVGWCTYADNCFHIRTYMKSQESEHAH
jgi:hypothetical protein